MLTRYLLFHIVSESPCKNLPAMYVPLFLNYLHDSDPGPWDLCVVAAKDKFTWTTEVLWRKRDGMATLQVKERLRGSERAQPLPGQAFIAFLVTLHGGWSSFTISRFIVGDYLLQTTKKRNHSKRRTLQIKEESG